MSGLRWAVAVTTVVSRRDDLLPRTLASLAAAGWPELTLFVDGCTFQEAIEYERRFSLPVEVHRQRIKTAGCWELALRHLIAREVREMFMRQPSAERYLIAQDDCVLAKGLREYLERTPYPDKGYINCYLFPSNEELVPKDAAGKPIVGFYPSNQLGRGAVALVFSREAALTLLATSYMAERPADAHRGHKSVDGGVVSAMKTVGYREFVHFPSLVQHTGTVSSMGNRVHPLAPSFRGETWDARELLS